MDLSLERWEGITPAEREAIAKRLAMQLPLGFYFDAIKDCQLGDQQRQVAFYSNKSTSFALIPGGIVSLGYDADRGWEPQSDELESWQKTAREYGIGKTLKDHIVDSTLRSRHTELRPFLVETIAAELGWEPISSDDPKVHGILRNHGPNKHVEVSDGDTTIRVRIGEEGAVIAERSLTQTHREITSQLEITGFRLPTSDEWEYLCGACAPTLFRWGDHVPCDRYPIDISPEEAAWRSQWALAGGKLEYPPGGFASDWDYHKRPNAFGLLIASNPYNCELVAEIGVTRGGDGGSMVCGGAGFWVAWLTLATAYFEEHSCKHDPQEPIAPGYTIGRRVLDLR